MALAVLAAFGKLQSLTHSSTNMMPKSRLSKLIATILSHSFTLAFSHPSFIAHLLSRLNSLPFSLSLDLCLLKMLRCWAQACVRASVCKPIFFHFSFILFTHTSAHNTHTHISIHTQPHEQFFSPLFYAFIVGVMEGSERESERQSEWHVS